MRILIVDDEEINRFILSEYIRKRLMSAELEFAVNGSDAVSMFRTALEDKLPYELVIIDYQMPVMRGDDAVRCIRELEMQMSGNKRFCTICVSSAEQNCTEVFREWIDNDENFCTLPKPVDFKQLESIYSSVTRTCHP